MKAVIFDLGGVVLGSPLHMIAEYEREHGIELGTINRVVMASGADGAWSQFERGRIRIAEFVPAFEGECLAAGARVDARLILRGIEHVAHPRPQMVAAIGELRAQGFAVAALTNNFCPLDAPHLTDCFDVVVQSSVEGVRKPQPRIYEIVLERLGIDAADAIFLDDIGGNLKPARAMGIATIKVTDPDQALDELGALLGITLA